ncbi:OmpA family protein [Polyangium aurulentum]|uniref:OmpA family protein n=1 Tax=Polyangium aurulentum TaxID=2567896 RepID=UPI0010AE48FA|nr:OmpA family protein [Polyangium aurulentum]UQA58635.1 OmpA family protein [Polyangium aurulentum]
MLARAACSLACAGAASLLPAVALAQASTALDRLEPAPAGDGFVAVPRADVPGELRGSASLLASYAHAPLTLRTGTPGDPSDVGDLVSYQLALHVLAGLELFGRAKIDVDVPVTLSQGGESPLLGGTTYASPTGAAMNDVRLGLRVNLLRQRGNWPAASLSYAVWVPTGDEGAYTGTGEIRHAPAVVVGAEHGPVTWSFTVGRRFQDMGDGRGLLGGEILGGVAGAWRILPALTAHAEIFGATVTGDAPVFARGTTGLEAIVGARYAAGPLWFGLAAGPGITRGAGTPSFRLLATVGAAFGPKAVERRTSGEGDDRAMGSGDDPRLATAKPPSSAVASAKPPDGDGDSVPDAEDACPTRVGDARPDAFRRGCPLDTDGDKIADADDRCPEQVGVASVDPARYGCPPDTDGDGISDDTDACPKEQGKATTDPKTHGCPTSVRVEGTQIVILQEVNFATGKDEIAKESYPLLEQIAAVLAQHPEIARLAVDGHTDNVGAEKKNIALSQRRAVAVVHWLVEHRVDARRLEARGFGPRRPIASNDKPEGRAKNRRVEFQILKKTDLGEAGWTEGAAK